MLYCPKCQKKYEEGTQRFCSVEGERLLPLTDKFPGKPSGIFTNVLIRKNSEEEDDFSSVPKFSQAGSRTFSQPTFNFPANSKIFQSDPELELELEPLIESKPILSEPLPPFVKSGAASAKKEVVEEKNFDDKAAIDEQESTPSVADDAEEVSFGTAADAEKLLEIEETFVSASDSLPEMNHSDSLLGQTINERYHVVEQIGEDENGKNFLAEDELLNGRFVNLKEIIDTDAEDSFSNQIYADERESLAQINHPNIANILETGKLKSGAAYIVSENFEGLSVKDLLEIYGQFDVLRAARIVRQAADALTEAHQVGVTHRNLKPENLILTVTENGAEQVKVTNFGAPKETFNEENLLYKAPEQVEGKIANSTSDEYALAVIAYQMLTGELPFQASTVGELLKAQREGLKTRPSKIRTDVPLLIDEILERALSFNSFDRFSTARDFGDDFFSEIFANAPLEDEFENEKDENEEDSFVQPLVENETPAEISASPISDSVISAEKPVIVETPKDIAAEEDEELIHSVKATHDLAWEKRASEMPNEANPRRNLLSILGVGAVLIALFGVWYYFINRPAETFTAPEENIEHIQPITNASPSSEANTNVIPSPEEIEAPPLARSIKQPPDTIYFQNSRENLKGDAAKNFLGFSLYFPKDWKLNEVNEDERDSNSRGKFLDISKDASSGTPVEQMLVSYYNSKGTFKLDTEVFPSLVKETNETLKKILPNYEAVSESEITVNNGWRAYQVSFQGTGTTSNGEKITLWGRRIFIPTAVRGMKNGYVITMLATSLSKDVKSVQDVGVKGDLANILETFEPNQNF